MEKIKILIISLLINLSSYAAFIDVRIYSSYQINSFMFTPLSGKYIIKSEGAKILDLYKYNTLVFRKENDKVRISKQTGEEIGLFSDVEISGASLQNIFKIEPLNVNSEARFYDDDIILDVTENEMMLINKVDIERFVAAVVQSEVYGSTDKLAYYEIQSIITRTYTLNNLLKHSKEGYNYCDNVHCQSYKRRCNNSDILASVLKTNGMVVVDKNKKLISAAYYSNSGGETMGSEDVWSIPTTYLKSKIDSFSLSGRNAYWTKKMLLKDWLEFLSKTYNYPITQTDMLDKVLNFKQEKRKTMFENNIPLKSIRRDLSLRSTFFNIETKGDTVCFYGKGYGHGVGLSQEGAINMVQKGYTYEQIIKYYYTNVDVVNVESIK